jgi:hypothetical protein
MVPQDSAYGVYPGNNYYVKITVSTTLVGRAHVINAYFTAPLDGVVNPPSRLFQFVPDAAGDYTFNYEFAVGTNAQPGTSGVLVINLRVNGTNCNVISRIPVTVLGGPPPPTTGTS